MILRVAKDKLVIAALGFEPTKWMLFVILCCCLYEKRQVLDLHLIHFTPTVVNVLTMYVLKVKVNYKRTELTVFVDKLHQLIEEQQREVEKAMVSSGKCYLQSSYKYLSVPQN